LPPVDDAFRKAAADAPRGRGRRRTAQQPHRHELFSSMPNLKKGMRMAVVEYSYEKSGALSEELDCLEKKVHHCMDEFGDWPLRRFIETFTRTVPGLEFVDAAALLDPRSEVLDVGVGFGQSSMYLAGLGHAVTAIEPSAPLCRFLDHFSNKFDLNIDIHQCSIEAFTKDKKFDACVFNASFHHCSDPVPVLAKCRGLLREKGRVFLVNENILKFYRSKKWFYRTLETNPERLDHYGGNEHVYRHSEYVRMLRQGGFSGCVEKIPVFYRDIRSVYELTCQRKESGRFRYNETQLIARFLFYYCMWRAVKIPFLRAVAKRLSLILCTYIGSR
jgi:2-polyprenyl-3-methyl-5-hydroxy-6-metoxy-1,4-benzoquinol methylase